MVSNIERQPIWPVLLLLVGFVICLLVFIQIYFYHATLPTISLPTPANPNASCSSFPLGPHECTNVVPAHKGLLP